MGQHVFEQQGHAELLAASGDFINTIARSLQMIKKLLCRRPPLPLRPGVQDHVPDPDFCRSFCCGDQLSDRVFPLFIIQGGNIDMICKRCVKGKRLDPHFLDLVSRFLHLVPIVIIKMGGIRAHLDNTKPAVTDHLEDLENIRLIKAAG